MKNIDTDICVIGGGSGGLSVAAGAAQMGARVVLLEGHKMGGDCLNFGCVPSKALLAAGKRAHAMRGGLGVGSAQPCVDFGAAKDHVAAVIADIAPHDSVERFESLGVRVITEYGRFISPREVQAGDHVIRARRFVVATGSAPAVPPIPGLGSVPHLTNETIFELRERPEHLLILGGGPIGLEMAQAHRRLGSAVTVIEGATALARDDPEAAALVLEKLRDEGIEIVEGAMAQEVATCEGGIMLRSQDGRSYHGSHLLLATGRRAALDRLNLDAAGVAHAEGAITVDSRLRSSNRRVHAIGDAIAQEQFTHVANYHAGIVIRSMLFGLPARARRDHLPWVTYTDPELAQVGLTEADALARHGAALEVVRFDYRENDRARAEARTEGFIKVMIHKGRPVGATIVGAQAGELIGVWALAIAQRMKMGQIAGMVIPYPSLGEINKRAAGAYFIPRLFENPRVKRIVRLVQKVLP